MEYNYNQIQNSNLDYLQVNEILNIQEAREYKIALAMLEKNALPLWINSPEMCLPIFDFARRIKMPFLSLVQNLYKVGDTITLTGKGMLAIIYSHGGEYRVLEEFEILCKEKDNKKVEYSFRDFSKPMGVAVYKTSEKLPPALRKALPDSETLKKLMD